MASNPDVLPSAVTSNAPLSVAPSRKNVVVAGDLSVEWRITRSAVPDQGAVLPEFSTRTYSELGGVTALGALINATVAPEHDVDWLQLENVDVRPSAAPYWHLYTTCSQRRFSTRDQDRDQKAVWRVSDWMGIDRPRKSTLPPDLRLTERGKGDLVVIEDARNGFADDPGAWPDSFVNPKPGAWLVLRWAGAHFDEGHMAQFWDHARRHFNRRIVLVVTVDELCIASMRINRSLSWERTALDVMREINGWHRQLQNCAHIVVGFSTAGAMLFSPNEKRLRARLYYDPAHLYKSWSAEYEGTMIGYTRCLMAGVIIDMLNAGDAIRPPGRKGIVSGIWAARRLQRRGFDPIKEDGSPDDAALPHRLRFPVTHIANGLKREYMKPTAATTCFLDCGVPERNPTWRIIEDALSDEGKIVEAASAIVEHGDDNYDWKFPIARFGKSFLAVDRIEIESIRSVQELIKNYVAGSAASAPVSVAVFGAPGNGKSHAIKAVAEHLATQVKLEAKTFNVSQFSSPESINNALHEVRDVGLSGKMPLVFWDEFDTKFGDEEFGWLRFFLAPMQDGKFQDRQLTHNIGKAIFVFAGGTSSTKAEFERKATPANGPLNTLMRMTGKSAGNKTPDFLSRLSGYVDITDLNHTDRKIDPAVVIRRAVRLRMILKQSAGDLVHSFPGPNNKLHERVNIHSNVLRAFLLVPTYMHGARSMEAIVKMSALSGRRRFDPSNLPPVEQLGLHVDVEAFIQLLQPRSS